MNKLDQIKKRRTEHKDGAVYIYGSKHGPVIVDVADLHLVFWNSWMVYAKKDRHTQYVVSRNREPGKHFVSLHRIIMGAKYGEVVDHINGNGLDNRRANLRIAPQALNMCNRRPGKNKSGFKGVTVKSGNKFQSHVTFKGKVYYLGRYDSAIEAAKAYDKKAIELMGEFAWTNFPRQALADVDKLLEGENG